MKRENSRLAESFGEAKEGNLDCHADLPKFWRRENGWKKIISWKMGTKSTSHMHSASKAQKNEKRTFVTSFSKTNGLGWASSKSFENIALELFIAVFGLYVNCINTLKRFWWISYYLMISTIQNLNKTFDWNWKSMMTFYFS